MGSVVLFVGTLGSWKRPDNFGRVCRLNAGGTLEEIGKYDYKTEFVSLRDRIAELVAEQDSNPLAPIMADIAALVKKYGAHNVRLAWEASNKR